MLKSKIVAALAALGAAVAGWEVGAFVSPIPETHDYSLLQERPTGDTWVDGSDVYCKVVYIGAMPSAGPNTVASKVVAHGIPSIGNIVALEGMMVNSAGNDWRPLPYVSAVGNGASFPPPARNDISLQVTATNVVVQVEEQPWVGWEGYVSVFYTQ